jgi:hypothetical protein
MPASSPPSVLWSLLRSTLAGCGLTRAAISERCALHPRRLDRVLKRGDCPMMKNLEACLACAGISVLMHRDAEGWTPVLTGGAGEAAGFTSRGDEWEWTTLLAPLQEVCAAWAWGPRRLARLAGVGAAVAHRLLGAPMLRCEGALVCALAGLGVGLAVMLPDGVVRPVRSAAPDGAVVDRARKRHAACMRRYYEKRRDGRADRSSGHLLLTKRAVYGLWAEHGMPATRIADLAGVSPQRVRQIIALFRAASPPPAPPPTAGRAGCSAAVPAPPGRRASGSA